MKHRNYFLPCVLGKGMFSWEYSVKIEIGKDVFSLFVPKDGVRNGNGKKGMLPVELIEQRGKSGVVRLPSETLEVGFRVIEVPLSILQPKAA